MLEYHLFIQELFINFGAKNYEKHLLILGCCLIIAVISNGQTVNDLPIEEIEVEYIKIVGSLKPLSNKIHVKIDFGQENTSKQMTIMDADGKKMEFNSMMFALNFMRRYGYEFVQAYTSSGKYGNTYYIMRKKKPVEK